MKNQTVEEFYRPITFAALRVVGAEGARRRFRVERADLGDVLSEFADDIVGGTLGLEPWLTFA